MKPKRQSLPFTRAYWAEPDRILAGFYPGDRDPSVATAKLQALLECGVTDVFCLMEENEGDHAGRPFSEYQTELLRLARLRDTEVRWSRFAIRDLDVPSVPEMARILDAIDAVTREGCAYVHCWGGRGRTGTVMGCWFARHGIATGENALSRLAELTADKRMHFQQIPETGKQRSLVREWRVGQ
jgi:hypothetical protein